MVPTLLADARPLLPLGNGGARPRLLRPRANSAPAVRGARDFPWLASTAPAVAAGATYGRLVAIHLRWWPRASRSSRPHCRPQCQPRCLRRTATTDGCELRHRNNRWQETAAVPRRCRRGIGCGRPRALARCLANPLSTRYGSLQFRAAFWRRMVGGGAAGD